ncbi:hypothetical protein E2C01_081851 [Portunus trituberculatus]|uniref:Uncharacterized protein n=1 Tax=Portunus trituberculatus TaxID=210409 RepID=A0A5B7IXQ4_PORTR|nr:hypothetical protein [Portunus trituberculatus]
MNPRSPASPPGCGRPRQGTTPFPRALLAPSHAPRILLTHAQCQACPVKNWIVRPSCLGVAAPVTVRCWG